MRLKDMPVEERDETALDKVDALEIRGHGRIRSRCLTLLEGSFSGRIVTFPRFSNGV